MTHINNPLKRKPTLTQTRHSRTISDVASSDSYSFTGLGEHAAQLLRDGWQQILVHDYKSAEEEFEIAEEMCAAEGNPQALLEIHKCIGAMWMQVHNVRRALVHLKKMKSYATQAQLPKEKMKSYRDIGTCYQLVRKYETALLYFKKLLELAWYTDNIEMELSAYDLIGKQYYYLGQMDRAMYYSNRAWRGIIELKTSSAKILARNALEARKKPKLHYGSEATGYRAYFRPNSRGSSDISDSELPSPITNSSTAVTLSQLPYKAEEPHLPKAVQLPPLKKSDSHKLNKSLIGSADSEPSSFIIISHLSLNRSLKNYQCLKDARKVKVREPKAHKDVI